MRTPITLLNRYKLFQVLEHLKRDYHFSDNARVVSNRYAATAAPDALLYMWPTVGTNTLAECRDSWLMWECTHPATIDTRRFSFHVAGNHAIVMLHAPGPWSKGVLAYAVADVP